MVYKFDESGLLIDYFPDKNTVEDAEHETLIAPPDGLYEPKFDIKSQTWTGISETEWDKEHPYNPEPSVIDKAIAALTLQMAKQSEKQDEFNAQLLLKLAQLGGGTNVQFCSGLLQ